MFSVSLYKFTNMAESQSTYENYENEIRELKELNVSMQVITDMIPPEKRSQFHAFCSNIDDMLVSGQEVGVEQSLPTEGQSLHSVTDTPFNEFDSDSTQQQYDEFLHNEHYNAKKVYGNDSVIAQIDSDSDYNDFNDSSFADADKEETQFFE